MVAKDAIHRHSTERLRSARDRRAQMMEDADFTVEEMVEWYKAEVEVDMQGTS